MVLSRASYESKRLDLLNAFGWNNRRYEHLPQLIFLTFTLSKLSILHANSSSTRAIPLYQLSTISFGGMKEVVPRHHDASCCRSRVK
jgi:hypothetical protein